jgi:hypothetical protein
MAGLPLLIIRQGGNSLRSATSNWALIPVRVALLSKKKRRSCDLRFFLVREPIAVLVDYEQNHEQGGNENDVRRSVHVVKNAIDFFHVYLLRAGVKPVSIVEWFGQN